MMGVGVSLAARGGGRGGAGAPSRVGEWLDEKCDSKGGQFYFFSKTPPTVIARHFAGPFVQVLLYIDTVGFFLEIIFKFSFFATT